MSEATAVTLRVAEAADLDTLAALNRFVHDEHLARRPDYFKPAESGEVAAWFAALLRRPLTTVWIAEHAGEPVGYITAMVSEEPENAFRRARRWCEIDQLAVHPRWRRRGIACRLLERVVSDAEANGLQRVELNTWIFNEIAHAVFRRAGFTPRTVRFEWSP